MGEAFVTLGDHGDEAVTDADTMTARDQALAGLTP